MVKVISKYIAPSVGYFEIDNGNSVYRLLDKMTQPMNYEQSRDFNIKAKEKGDAFILSSKDFYQKIMHSAWKSKNSDLLNRIQKGLQQWPFMATTIEGNPIGETDRVIHYEGCDDEEIIRQNIVGKDGWISNISDEKVLVPFLGTREVKTINKVSNAINKTPMYLWRFNLKPEEKDKGVMRFDANSDRLDLNAYGSFSYKYPAFLVERIK